jgi:hypothetical protein
MRFLTKPFLLSIAILTSGCATSDRFAEFRRYEKEANGRFLGVLGFALTVPGVDDFEKNYSYTKDVFVIPNTSDGVFGTYGLEFNRRAAEFARNFNRRLLKEKEKGSTSR